MSASNSTELPEAEPEKPGGRRGFFRALAGAGGVAAGLAAIRTATAPEASAAEIPPPLAESPGSLIVRMQNDLDRAQASGRTPSWRMVVDTRKCIGCDACSIACRAENPTGPAGNFRRVLKLELPTGPRP